MTHNDPANDNHPDQPRERRGEARQRVFLRGKIVYAQTYISADCKIRDLSPGGARITVNPEAITGEPFLIVVKDAVAHQSNAAWQTSEQAGLRFQNTVDLTAETPPHVRNVQRLWFELLPH